MNAALAAIDETFRQLERKSVMETMSAVNSPIQEQDEPEDGNDNTLSADEVDHDNVCLYDFGSFKVPCLPCRCGHVDQTLNNKRWLMYTNPS